MKLEWLVREGRSRLLVFFAGWAMDARPFRRLSSSRYDVCVCFDYRSFESVIEQTTSGNLAWCDLLDRSGSQWSSAGEVAVVAWSFGCAVAAQLMDRVNWPVHRAVAVNGTLTPEDQRFGIPPQLISATADNLLSGGWEKFVRRMCLDRAARDHFQQSPAEPDLERAAEELDVLRRIRRPPAECRFTHALVGTKDRIILPENQQNGWNRFGVPVHTIAAPHYPFHLWKCWDELIESAHERGNV